MIYFGMGLFYVVSFLSVCNILLIDLSIIKKKEKEIYLFFKRQVLELCNNVLVEECEVIELNEFECSFDVGWQIRGFGWQYSSNLGM